MTILNYLYVVLLSSTTATHRNSALKTLPQIFRDPFRHEQKETYPASLGTQNPQTAAKRMWFQHQEGCLTPIFKNKHISAIQRWKISMSPSPGLPRG